MATLDDCIDAELERLLAAPPPSQSVTYDFRELNTYTPSNVMDLHLLSPAEITSQLRDMRRGNERRRKRPLACAVSIDELPPTLVARMSATPPKGRVFSTKLGWKVEATSVVLGGKSITLGTFDDILVANFAYNIAQCQEHVDVASVHGGVQRFIVDLALQHSRSVDA
jgi:hypothetical protein